MKTRYIVEVEHEFGQSPILQVSEGRITGVWLDPSDD